MLVDDMEMGQESSTQEMPSYFRVKWKLVADEA